MNTDVFHVMDRQAKDAGTIQKPSADGPEQREADRLERDTYDHDEAADRADERERSPFAAMVFSATKAANDTARVAYNEGYKAGYAKANADALKILDKAFAVEKTTANVCPTCHGRGASVMSAAGTTVYYCNCEVA